MARGMSILITEKEGVGKPGRRGLGLGLGFGGGG